MRDLVLTEEVYEPDNHLECSLIPGNRDSLWVHVIPEVARLGCLIGDVVDIVVLVIPLNEITFPECIDHVLRLGRGEESLSD